MAKFENAFKKVIINEGGYINDPDDNGGETFMGITRKNYPHSDLWKIIDSYKNKYSARNMFSALKNNRSVIDEVEHIYKKYYWDLFKLDYCKSQSIADEIFDTAVNMGVNKATKIIQRVLNIKDTGKLTNDLLDKFIDHD